MSTFTRFSKDQFLDAGELCEWYIRTILHKDGTEYAFDYVIYTNKHTSRHDFCWSLFNHDPHATAEYHVGDSPLFTGSSKTIKSRERDIANAVDEAIAEIRNA
jgi:hypothetical protein